MYPVGILFGLGLETASEVTLLALSASAASAGGLPLLAVLSLPLLFAAGMSACDTADSLLMSRAYSWAFNRPARRLYYNMASTAMTVVVAGFIASVYLAALAARAASSRGGRRLLRRAGQPLRAAGLPGRRGVRPRLGGCSAGVAVRPGRGPHGRPAGVRPPGGALLTRDGRPDDPLVRRRGRDGRCAGHHGRPPPRIG